MIFAPLAIDATPQHMERIVKTLCEQSPPRAFDELAVALMVLADADKRQRPRLRQAIVASLPKKLVMHS